MIGSLKHSGRRAFLRGAGGAALALPLLEYTHGNAWASDGDASLRFLTVFSHGGTMSNVNLGGTEEQWQHLRYDGTGEQYGHDRWRPLSAPGDGLVLGPIHQPLEAWRQKLVILEGIDNKAAFQYNSLGGHGVSNVSVLTSGHVVGPEDSEAPDRASIDHIIAQRLAARQPVPFDAIHLMVTGHQYGTPYFSGPQQSISSEKSPRAAFNTIFDGVTGGEPDPQIVLRNTKRTSVLDGLMDGYSDFHGRISVRDRHVIEAHLDHINALQQQVQDPVICTPPSGIDEDSDAPGNVVASLMAQIIVVALRCGLTNVANLQIADILSPWTSAGHLEDAIGLGLPIGHALHHLARDVGATGPSAGIRDDWEAYTLENRRWRMSVVAELLAGLDDANFMEGDRTLLDNSLLLFTSEFSNGSRHSAHNLPVMLAGSAGGVIETGRFLSYNTHLQSDPNTQHYGSNESMHNLCTSILQAFGEEDQHFGNDHCDHQGPLPDLLG